MREVSPGDLVFSFADAKIGAIGIAQAKAVSSPKPENFNAAGERWADDGWKVDVHFEKVKHPVRVKNHIDVIRPALRPKFAPILQNGNGKQAVYLAEIDLELADILLELLGSDAQQIVSKSNYDGKFVEGDREAQETKIAAEIQNDPKISATTKLALVNARVGQGEFRTAVLSKEPRCRITGVSNPAFLVASHIKPWRKATNPERLDGDNGLMLTPSIDRLFDRGYIGFQDDGTLIISEAADKNDLVKLGVPVDKPLNVGPFREGQYEYLKHHRDEELNKPKARHNP